METLKFLREHSLDELIGKYKLVERRHNEYPNLVLLKYHQIESNMNERIVQECRGLILDEDNEWRVVCRSMDKFFNTSEPQAAKIDWATARTYEKVDGSLCQLYYYDKNWQIATSGSPDASGNVNDYGFTFRELFWRVWSELKYKLPEGTSITYFFELMTPFNRVVVDHHGNDIILLGARRLDTFQELNPVVEAHINEWKCVRLYDFNDRSEVEEQLKGMNGLEQEGFVVCDAQYRRVKMKCEDYVKRHRLVSSMSYRNMLDVIRTNESAEVLPMVPQFKDLHWEIRVKYERLLGEMIGFYDGIKHLDDRKQFALLATTKHYSGALFDAKFKGTSFKQYLADMNIKALEKWLGIKDEEDG